MMADEEVEQAITIDIGCRDPRHIVLLTEVLPLEDGGRVGSLLEPAIASGYEQSVGPGHEDVPMTVTGEVGHRHPETVDTTGQTGGRRGVLEAKIAQIPQQDTAPSRESVLGDEEVVQTVDVVIEHADRATSVLGGETAVFDRDHRPTVVAEDLTGRGVGGVLVVVAGDHEVEVAIAIEVGHRASRGAGEHLGKAIIECESA